MVSSQARHNPMKVKIPCRTEKLVDMVVQSVTAAWCKLIQKGGLLQVSKALALYMLFGEAKARIFFVM